MSTQQNARRLFELIDHLLDTNPSALRAEIENTQTNEVFSPPINRDMKSIEQWVYWHPQSAENWIDRLSKI